MEKETAILTIDQLNNIDNLQILLRTLRKQFDHEKSEDITVPDMISDCNYILEDDTTTPKKTQERIDLFYQIQSEERVKFFQLLIAECKQELTNKVEGINLKRHASDEC